VLSDAYYYYYPGTPEPVYPETLEDEPIHYNKAPSTVKAEC